MIEPWLAELWPPGRAQAFRMPEDAERQAFAALMAELLRAAKDGSALPPDTTERAAALGFRLERWSAAGEGFLALLEAPDKQRGAGAYVLRIGPSGAPAAEPELVLQAPHSDSDLGTGELAARLFFTPPGARRPRAFFTNTVHRYKSHPDERPEDPEHPADVAHNPRHYFHAATQAVAGTLGRVVVIQLHGFDAKKPGRVLSERGEPSAIVSSGDRAGCTPWARKVAEALREPLGPEVLLFPDDVQAMGGTTNAQARLLRALPHAELLHVELAGEVRRRLRASSSLRDAFGTALLEPELLAAARGSAPTQEGKGR